MAQKTIITLIDDLDPDGELVADETVSFALDGVAYEIDLTTENAHVLRARLKQFKEAARVIKAGPRRVARPMTEPAGDGATLSRHRNGDDPADIRAWALQAGLTLPTRGRLPAKVGAAYRAAKGHNHAPLEELLREQQNDTATPAPAKSRRPLKAPKEAPHEKPAPAQDAPDNSDQDPNEAAAAQHYKPLTQLSPDALKKKWEKRTAHGCQRTERVAEMTLVERIEAIGSGASDRNVTILGMLAGVIPLKNGKVSFLSGSSVRLENLEMIQYAPETEHGWEITDFGRYAHQYHSAGG